MTALRHGWTLADINTAARDAALGVGARAADFHERYDTAWSAIAEHLYTTTNPPARHDLVTAGRSAILREEAAIRRSHGLPDRNIGQHSQTPRYVMYWQWAARTTPSPETSVVERHATRQILAALTARQQATVAAMAAGRSPQAAANLLGVPYRTVTSRMKEVRRRFFRLWHEGETPSRVWLNERAGSRTEGHRIMQAVRRRNGTARGRSKRVAA
ncbi:hypothetical protein [Micromonospora carbonacea]|uniref:hypothetical protein n=1 Tax=Micromonospora carbonacea TaxID=47853 RepID=UPI0037118E0E